MGFGRESMSRIDEDKVGTVRRKRTTNELKDNFKNIKIFVTEKNINVSFENEKIKILHCKFLQIFVS